MFVVHETLPNKKNWKNNAIPIYKSPHLWYGSGFFLLKNILMHLLLNKCKIHTFWKEFHAIFFKFLNCPKFNWCIWISYTIKKKHPIIPSTTLVLKYIYKISNPMIIRNTLSQIYSIHSSSSMFVGFLKIID